MKDLTFFTQNKIAHRGLHDKGKGILENTIEAYAKAIEKGYIIELDLHCIKDGEVVAFHDNNLKRMTGINKKIKLCTYNELMKINDMYIPKFKEVLQLVNGRVPLLIELKTDRKVGVLEKKVVELLKGFKGDYAIQTFNPLSLIWFKNNAPEVIRGQLSSNFKDSKDVFKKVILKNMLLNFISKPDFISYQINCLTDKQIKKIRKSKLLLGWTVKDKQTYDDLINKYDNLISENIL